MSEIIPSHIGSKLTDFSSIVVDETSASDWPQDEEQSGFQEKEEVNETDIALNTKQGNTMQKRKKAAPKATTKRKRTNGVKKSLPRNPGAGAATSEAVADLQLPPLDLEVLEEEKGIKIDKRLTPRGIFVIMMDELVQRWEKLRAGINIFLRMIRKSLSGRSGGNNLAAA